MANLRWLLLVGGVLILVACAGLALNGDATVRAFEVLKLAFTDTPPSPPGTLAQLAVVAGFAGLLGVGWIFACGGISAPDPGRYLTLAGRLCYVAAGLATMVSAVPLIFGAMVLRHAFLMLAWSESAPSADQLDAMMASTCGYVPVGFYIGLAAGAFVILAGCVGFRGTNSSRGALRPHLNSYLVTGITAAVAILFGVFFLLVFRHAAALRDILLNAGFTPKPSELVEHLLGILSKSLAAYICLALLGAVQVLVAILAPTGRGEG